MRHLLPRAARTLASAAILTATLAAAPAHGATVELSPPAGEQAGERPRGHVLTIHGGGWTRVGPAMAARMDPDVKRLNGWGYATANVDYRAGAASFADVRDAYDALRRRVGPRAPICAYGSSAGGHLALMLAIRRPALACVVTKAAPALLRDLDPPLLGTAARHFEPVGGLDAWSPALYSLRTPLLAQHARHDALVPFGQAGALRAANPNARVVALGPGERRWTHARVNSRQLAEAHELERAFLARRMAAWSPRARSAAPRYTGPPDSRARCAADPDGLVIDALEWMVARLDARRQHADC